MALSKDEVLAGLAELVNDETGQSADQVQLDKSFTDDLDIDSISMMNIVMNAEDKFGVKRRRRRCRRLYCQRAVVTL